MKHWDIMQSRAWKYKSVNVQGGGGGVQDKLALRNPFFAILEPTAAQLEAIRQGAEKETNHMTMQMQSAIRLNRACKLISDSLRLKVFWMSMASNSYGYCSAMIHLSENAHSFEH